MVRATMDCEARENMASNKFGCKKSNEKANPREMGYGFDDQWITVDSKNRCSDQNAGSQLILMYKTNCKCLNVHAEEITGLE